MERPVIRATRAASSTFISITDANDWPHSFNRTSSATACPNVRGNPSKIKPPAFASDSFSRIKPITMSSVTKSPRAITSATFRPISLPLLLASRNISPVDSCTMSRVSTRCRACVPFPAPGGPNRIMFIDVQVLFSDAPFLYHAIAISG